MLLVYGVLNVCIDWWRVYVFITISVTQSYVSVFTISYCGLAFVYLCVV